MRTNLYLASVWLLAVAMTGHAAEPQRPLTPEELQFFESRVRPVLVDNCFKCHGPKKQQGGLRLDAREAMLKGGDDGAVVTPGEPDSSRLVQAVRHADKVKKMPPQGKLKPEEVEALAAWVKMGVPWPETATTRPQPSDAWKKHWAFQPIQKPPLPALKDARWPATTIDHFVLSRLEAKGLTPSPAAERRTLIRRATLDLIGLPPTPEEIAAFEADTSPDAFARVVDRLLASPHYGERWGRYWLDVARYADTKGYVFLDDPNFPWAYTYRDYVIRSFNEDLPYNRFIVEQLAADRLPLGTDKRPLTALGFLTVGGHFMSNPHDIIDDRIDVVARGLLGVTVTCARCHDHKFDPIPTRDYYSLYGVFASSTEPLVPPLFTEPPQTEAYVAFERELKIREGRLTEFVRAKHAELVQMARLRAGEYMQVAHAMRDQPDTEDFMLIADGSDLNPKMLRRWQTYLQRTGKGHHPVFAPWHAYAALPKKEFATKSPEISKQLIADPARPINPLVAKALTDKPPQSMAEVARRYGQLLAEVEQLWQQTLQQAEDLLDPAPTALGDPTLEELRQVLYGSGAPPMVPTSTYGDLDLLPDRPSQAKVRELRKALDQWRIHGSGAPPRAMALEDTPVMHEPRVFIRGNPGNQGAAVPRQFLGFLTGEQRRPFTDGSGRLELARAITDPANPLTARVLVNRVWLHHFGRPLVGTPSDFGLRSDPPSHPELLDHLATTFVADGWSLKKLHRLIMLSSVYQQASHDTTDGKRLDPENVLMWKMNRRRLDFEATRDSLLAVGGNLDPRIGGPSIKDITAAGATRRTVYGFIDRLSLPGVYRTFDFPTPDATNPRRDNTTVAPQALFMMNHPFVAQTAGRLLARRDIAGEKELAGKVERLYRVLYGRAPAPRERELARQYFGETPGGAEWERYAQALLMANEFVFVD